MMARLIFLLLVVVAAAMLLTRGQRANPASVHYETLEVRHGALNHVLRETGTLVSTDPVFITNRFHGSLKFVVDDGAWVNKDDIVYVISSDKAIAKVNDLRSQLLAKRRELKLALLKRDHAEDDERRQLESWKRAHTLESIRFRVVSTPPKGGNELVRLHEALLPLEKQLREVQLRFEQAQDRFLAAEDAYLELQDDYESSRDSLFREQSRADALAVIVDRDPDELQPNERQRRDAAVAELKTIEGRIQEIQVALPDMHAKMKSAKEKRDSLKPPLEQGQEKLTEVESATRELFVLLEIEKKGLTLAGLQLDERAENIRLAEAKRKFEDGEHSFAAGAISKARLDELADARDTIVSNLAIIQQRIKIESRPPSPEALEEASVRLKTAEAKADDAERAFAQAMAIKDAEINVIKAAIAKFEHDIAYASQGFVEIIEANLAHAHTELKLLDAQDAERRQALLAEIEALNDQLAEAEKNPPHIYKAPVAGIVRLKLNGRGEPTKVGDEWYEEDVIVRLYPPTSFEVHFQVNEVNVRQVAEGMGARVVVPALEHLTLDGSLVHVAGVAKDKFQSDKQRWYEKQKYADVAEFQAHVELAKTHPDLRQGMSVIVELLVETATDVTFVPASAVEQRDGKAHVLTGTAADPVATPIEGRFFGYDRFVVTSGLEAGDKVYITRNQNL